MLQCHVYLLKNVYGCILRRLRGFYNCLSMALFFAILFHDTGTLNVFAFMFYSIEYRMGVCYVVNFDFPYSSLLFSRRPKVSSWFNGYSISICFCMI